MPRNGEAPAYQKEESNMAIPQKRKFRTSKVLSGSRSEYRAWKEWDEGDLVIGKLLGSSPNKLNPGKKDWLLEVIEVGFQDKADSKRLGKAGTRLTLNTAGQLDKGLEQVKMGAIVQVTYNGNKEMEGGKYAGKMAHMMEVTEVEEDKGEEESEEEFEDDEDTDL